MSENKEYYHHQIYQPPKDGRCIYEKQEEIFNHYGVHEQLEKLEEECLELALAIKHLKKEDSVDFTNVIEEMADVTLIIEQFYENNLYFKHGIDSWKKFKTDREIKRINQEL